MLLNPGVQTPLLKETTVGAGVTERVFTIQSDAVLAALSVSAVSGSIQVSVFAIMDTAEVEVIRFDPITAPTPQLVVHRSGSTVSTLIARVTYTGICSYDLQVRAIESGGLFPGGVNGGDGSDTGTAASPSSEDHIIRDDLIVLGDLVVTGSGTVAVIASSSGLHAVSIAAGSLVEAS